VRVLQINKFDFPKGGSDAYFLQLSERLRAGGTDVALMACASSDDHPLDFAVPPIDFHDTPSKRDMASAAARVLWSRTAAKVMTYAIERFRPDVAHFHGYAHQLSSSVVAAAYRAGVPTVATLHDYKLICPAYIAMRNDEQCFRCASGSPLHCFSGKCLHDSLPWSGLAAAEALLTRAASASTVPQLLLCPSMFMLNAIQNSWLNRTRAQPILMRNPAELPAVDFSSKTRRESSFAGLYVGRLVREKGLEFAIRAAADTGIGLNIVGDGPLRDELALLARTLGAPVSFLGYLSGSALQAVWEECLFSVLPSVWPENAPLAVLESMSRGIPVVATDVGGLPELVYLGQGGEVVPPRDVGALAEAFQRGAAGRLPKPNHRAVRQAFNWDDHLTRIAIAYDSVKLNRGSGDIR
jgi:glycosyltransferase involved in cell wall biosynthesis